MKKMFGFLLAVAMIAMLVVTPISVAANGQDVDINMGDNVTVGDVNLDGVINLKDLVLIAQAQAEWDVDYEPLACDTNADGKFDLADVTRLAEYLAGWNVAL